MIIINAENKVVGRIASFVAEQALAGQTVHVLQCENAVLTGPRAYNLANLHAHISLTVKGNPLRSPKYSKMADQILRIAIRGMLPKKGMRGRDAMRRVHCHIGTPAILQGQTITDLSNAKPRGSVKTTRIGELAQMMGAHN